MALLWIVPALMMSMAPTAGAQRPASPLPSGNRIVAQDGDVVVVENDARIRIVRRREGQVRAVFNEAERWLVLLVDHAMPARSPDGRVDRVHHFRNVGGAWPFGARWEGIATIKRFLDGLAGQRFSEWPHRKVWCNCSDRSKSSAMRTPWLSSHTRAADLPVPDLPFDEAERWYIAEVRRDDGVMRSPSGATGSLSVSVGGGFSGGIDSSGVVRVGGRVRPPVKLVDVPPVRPDNGRARERPRHCHRRGDHRR